MAQSRPAVELNGGKQHEEKEPFQFGIYEIIWICFIFDLSFQKRKRSGKRIIYQLHKLITREKRKNGRRYCT